MRREAGRRNQSEQWRADSRGEGGDEKCTGSHIAVWLSRGSMCRERAVQASAQVRMWDEGCGLWVVGCGVERSLTLFIVL